MANRKLLILAVAIMLLFIIEYKPEPQTVVPECFEKEDCRTFPPEGYCEVLYDCVVGKCTSTPIRCPELCSGRQDEDYDGLIDCRDPDCFNSPYCHCEQMSYNWCVKGKCYCPSGVPRWYVSEEGSRCICY